MKESLPLSPTSSSKVVMGSVSTYALVLRAIGQALDQQQLEDFDLEIHDNEFLVRGKKSAPPRRPNLLKVVAQQIRRQRSIPLELRFTPAEVERLEEEGRLRRRDPDGLPDFYSLPQVMRTLGAYVDQKGARLVSLQRRGLHVTIQYEKSRGRPSIEERTIPYFYDLFVSMYLRRSSRQPTR